VTSERPKHSLS